MMFKGKGFEDVKRVSVFVRVCEVIQDCARMFIV